MKAQEFYNENDVIAVVTTEPFARFLDYLAPEGGCKVGSFLILPLGKRKVIGVVWGLAKAIMNAQNCVVLRA